ncbi:MAG: AAA family ATPase [Firmicutes bacterium]|nr:AAA family ATPase [Bacillota bacterium]
MTSRISRVKRLTVDGVKGFVTPTTVNTDADIVLVAGANGFGKTSLIDALCVALTGVRDPDREPFLCSFGRGSAPQPGQIRMRTSDSEQSNFEYILEIPADAGAVRPSDDGDAPWALATSEERQVAVRASFFYQDALNRLFEEEDPLIRLEDYLLGGTASISTIQSAIKDGVKYLNAKIGGLRLSRDLPTEQ